MAIFARRFLDALPIATQSATPQPAQSSPSMIRLRLPSEKPTREDADKDGFVIVFNSKGVFVYWTWSFSFDDNIIAWLPGRLPDGILPREPSQEEKWRAEFEERFSHMDISREKSGEYHAFTTEMIWRGFFAAREGARSE